MADNATCSPRFYGIDGTVILAPQVIRATAGTGISAAARTDGFAIAWGDMGTPPGASSAYPAVLFETLQADGTPTGQIGSNDVVGLSAADDYVDASEPQVVATASGYVVGWKDVRLMYPPQQGVNMANTQGLYGRHITPNGASPDFNDVQIVQEGYWSFAVGGGADATIAWSDYGNGSFMPDGTLRTGTLGGQPSTVGYVGQMGLSVTGGSAGVEIVASGRDSTNYSTQLLTASGQTVNIASGSNVESTSLAVDWGTGSQLSVVWLNSVQQSGTTSSAQLRAATLSGTSAANVRTIGSPFLVTLDVNVSTAAILSGAALVPVATTTSDNVGHLEIATLCGS